MARGLNADDVRRLLAIIPDTVVDRRDRALLLTFVVTGRRRAALLADGGNVDIGDLGNFKLYEAAVNYGRAHGRRTRGTHTNGVGFKGWMPVARRANLLRNVALLLLATALLSGCEPSTADRERMAAEMQAAAPDLIEGYHVNRGSLIDDATLDIWLIGNPADEDVHRVACNVVAPIMRAHGEAGLPVDLWLERGYGKHLGDVREICSD